jgi:D-alanyl-D-alanine carboxypeptidase
MTSIKDNIGRGIYPFAHNDLSGFGHGGHIDASHSISMYFPREDLALSVTANGIDMNINGLFTYILKSYQNESFVITELHSVDILVDELQQYVGVYSGKGPGKFSITIKNGTLYSQLNDGPNDPLVYNGNHVFTNSEVGASFIFDPTKNTLGLEQKGVADIYYFTKE